MNIQYLFNYFWCNQAPFGFGVCEIEMKRYRPHCIDQSYPFFRFLITEYMLLPTQNVPATIAYISGNASRRAIPAEFSSERHLRPRNVTCIRVYVSGTCMPRVVDLRASLVRFCPSVCVCVYVCVRVCVRISLAVRTERRSIVI